MTPTKLSVIIATLASAAVGFVYIVMLREPGSAFYPCAAIAFVGCPIAGGILAALKTRKRKLKAFIASGSAVFGVTLVLFIVTYAVLPQFDRASVQLPSSCDGFDGVLDLPSQLAYTVPGEGAGVLLAESAESAVVATLDGDRPPFRSTTYLVRKSDGAVLKRMHFGNDVVIASIDAGTVTIYNDKLGYAIDERTGEFERNVLLIDNYGGLSETDRPIVSRASLGNWYLETTAVISSWRSDGTVKSRPRLVLNGIARGCYVAGATREVTPLGP